MQYLFTYGTLVNRSLASSICQRDIPNSYSEVLKGYRKVGLNIVEDEDSEVHGVAYEVTAADLKNLDIYEGVSHGLYKRINVMLESGEPAIAYQLVS